MVRIYISQIGSESGADPTNHPSATSSSSASPVVDTAATDTTTEDTVHHCYDNDSTAFKVERIALREQGKEIRRAIWVKQYQIRRLADAIVRECQISDPAFARDVRESKLDSIKPPQFDDKEFGEPALREVRRMLEEFTQKFIKLVEEFNKNKKLDTDFTKKRDGLRQEIDKWLSDEFDIEALKLNEPFTKRLDAFKVDFLKPLSKFEKGQIVDKLQRKKDLEALITAFLECPCVNLAMQAKVNARLRFYEKILVFRWPDHLSSRKSIEELKKEVLSQFPKENPELRAKFEDFMSPCTGIWNLRAQGDDSAAGHSFAPYYPSLHECWTSEKCRWNTVRHERIAQLENKIEEDIVNLKIKGSFDHVLNNLLRKIKQRVLVPESLQATVVEDYTVLNNRVREFKAQIEAFMDIHFSKPEVVLSTKDLMDREEFLEHHAAKFEELANILVERIDGWCCDLTALENCKSPRHLRVQDDCQHRTPDRQWYVDCGEHGLRGDLEKGIVYFRKVKEEAASGAWKKTRTSPITNNPMPKKQPNVEPCDKGSCSWEAKAARNWGVPLLLVGIWGVHVALALRRR